METSQPDDRPHGKKTHKQLHQGVGGKGHGLEGGGGG